FFLVITLACRLQGATQTDEIKFYLAPGGNDENPGTIQQPFETLTRARDALRKLKKQGEFEGSVTVLLRGGTYYLQEPLVLTAEDSGGEQRPVTYAAYPGEKPVLSGAKNIRSWSPYKGKILQCFLQDVKDAKWRFRQLYFAGERQIRARYPNFDREDPLYGGWTFIDQVADETKNPKRFRYREGTFARDWAKPQQAEVVIFPWYGWVNDAIPIAKVDHEDNLIRLTRAVKPDFMSLMAGNRFYVANVLEELDTPGEWCLDTETGTLYFWPPERLIGVDQVIAPSTDQLVVLRGTPSDPIRHVRFSGLTFTQTLSTWPDERHPNFHAPTYRGAAVTLENAHYCEVDGNRFHKLGGDGVRLQDACAFNTISHNTIADVGGQGISFATTGEKGQEYLCGPTWRDPETLEKQSKQFPKVVGNVVSHNYIHHTGQIEGHGAGIMVWGLNSVDNTLAHNHIHHTPHAGITVQDGFGRVIVEYNYIHDVCLELADNGGIFFNRWFVIEQDEDLRVGNVVRYNLVRNAKGCGAYGKPRTPVANSKAGGKIWTPYFTWGIYFDNSPIGAHVYGNICVGNTLGGIFFSGMAAKDVIVENNIFAESSIQQMDLPRGGEGNIVRRNIVYYSNPGAALIRITKIEALAECDFNVYFQAAGAEMGFNGIQELSLAKWREMGLDNHSKVSDPMFVDFENGDYRLKPESPALALGFESIDTSQIGPQARPEGPAHR
ncbi:MAG: right-handed parallel beta-helix repeat-containing protein, partial [Pirellulales bacterium]|nr:right-handed parallel beta-helix repeat-containing protein [Pirellulales bacterium]